MFFLVLFFSNILILFFNQNIINLIAFYSLYLLLIKVYLNLRSFDSELENNAWIELIRVLLLLRSWYNCLIRYSEFELFKFSEFFMSFYYNVENLLKHQDRNIYINYLSAVSFNYSILLFRLSENETYFDTYVARLNSVSGLLLYV